MKKILLISLVILAIFLPFYSNVFADASTTPAVQQTSNWNLGKAIFESIAKGAGQVLMTVSSLALITAGWFLDNVIKYTVIEMAKNIGNPEGLGGSITTAWATLRDIANMAFIFVILFVAFQAMFSLSFGNVGKSVKNIIIAALLINFSLFFTKVVIDASNIVSVGFYNSITSQTNLTSKAITTKGAVANFTGISGGYMSMLGLQTFYGADSLDKIAGADKILTLGIMASLFMLVSAVIFFIAGVVLLARFVILIFIMILSPLAVVAWIIPGQTGQFNKWKDALIGQSFFAPLYFALTWVVFKLGTSMTTAMSAIRTANFSDIVVDPAGSVALVVNFAILMGLSVAALVMSKDMATKSTPYFKEVSGGIGTGVLGGGAWAARNTLGRGAKRIFESGALRNKAAQKGFVGGLARAGLWTANQGAKGSFDLRGSDTLKKLPGVGKQIDILGKAGGAGGFSKKVSNIADARSKYAKEMFSQTDAEKEKAKTLQPKYDEERKVEEKRIKDERLERVKWRETNARESGDADAIRRAQVYRADIENKNKKNIFEDSEYSQEFREGIKADYDKYAKAGEERIKKYANRVENSSPVSTTTGALAGAGAGVKIGAALGSIAGPVGTVIGASILGGVGAGLGKLLGEKIKFAWAENKAAARKIIADSKAPSKDKKLADAIKEMSEPEEPTPTAPTPTAPPPAPNPTP